ncbi:YcaO-like family protein [Nocardia wallacei]|uniref:YcaO-like family protein n=1 Tax=Nocardia wallacei TaxID=480035 RepID=UPI0024571D55|nr:YcaO-like family protein [Nocardia wallacei]
MTDTSSIQLPWAVWEQQLLERLDEFGITRVADTTGMDSLGVPTASATKPGTSDVIWVYSGKGRSQAQARVTAIMECLERTGGLWPSEPSWITETPRVLRRTHEIWEAPRFTYRQRPGLGDDAPQVWAEATQLRPTPGRVMVPADLAYNGRRPAGLATSPVMLSTSNGLAAAFTTDAALRHGLAEVIERDIISFAEVRASHLGYRFLATIAEQLGISTAALERYEDNTELAVTIDQATLPPDLADLVTRYRNAGLELVLKQLPNNYGLPAYGVAAVQQVDMTRYLGCAGYAVRTNSDIAVEAALLELAQTRATDLQGAREDRHEVEKKRLSEKPKNHWMATAGASATPYEPSGTDPSLSHLLDACAQAGLPEVAYTEFDGWPGISVVRVLVPHAETWHITAGWSELGPRLRAATNSRSA